MKKIAFIILLTAFYVSNLFAQSSVTKEEYAVYAEVLKSIYTQNFTHSGFKPTFVIDEDTVKLDYIAPGMLEPRPTLADYVDRKFSLDDLSENFKEKNKVSAKLEQKIPTEYTYNILAKYEIDKLLEIGKNEYLETLKNCKCLMLENGWSFQPLYKKYPNSYGYYNLSRIGFSRDGKYALIYANKVSGDQGEAMFYVLKKNTDGWKTDEKIWLMSWIT